MLKEIAPNNHQNRHASIRSKIKQPHRSLETLHPHQTLSTQHLIAQRHSKSTPPLKLLPWQPSIPKETQTFPRGTIPGRRKKRKQAKSNARSPHQPGESLREKLIFGTAALPPRARAGLDNGSLIGLPGARARQADAEMRNVSPDAARGRLKMPLLPLLLPLFAPEKRWSKFRRFLAPLCRELQ